MKFYGSGEEIPIEFLNECQRNMDNISDHWSDKDLLQIVGRNLKGAAKRWYNIIREQIRTYDCKTSFENRYWNKTIQHKEGLKPQKVQ